MTQSHASPCHRDYQENVRALLRPHSVAVVGASGNPTRISGLIVRLLARHGFPGTVYPVNPKYEEIAGYPCFASLTDVPPDEDIDVAIVYLSADQVVGVVDECGRRGVKAVVVITSGFSEVGTEGAALQDRLTAVARSHRMALCGPNCAGLANFTANFVAYGTTNFIDLAEIQRGPVALLSASGGLGNTIFTYCQERRVGMSHLIGLGNEAVTSAAEFLDVLVDDPDVAVILANIEAIRDPQRFFAAAGRAADQHKPIVVMKGGRSEPGRHSIMTHTAALGGSPEAYAGAFKMHGIVQVNDLDELADMAMLLTRVTPVAGRRVGVFSLPGGGTGLVSDLASDHGFEVPDLDERTVAALAAVLPSIAIPKNPLDPTAGFGRDSEKMRAALRIFAADPNIDIVVFFPLASQVEYSKALAEDLVAVASDLAKPVVAIWTAGRHLETGAWRLLHDAGIPLFTQTGPAFRALALARGYAEFIAGRDEPGSHDFGPHMGHAVGSLNGADPDSVRETLEVFGIRFPSTVVATSVEEAVVAARRLGVPVAMKIVSPDIAHKTETGGVRLAVFGDAEVGAAFTSIVEAAAEHHPDARIAGVDVQEMVPEGVELLLGVTSDDQLGPILTVGLGGIFAEVLRDIVQRPVPVSRAEARRMLGELRGARVLDGYRGRPPVDREAVIDAMLGLSALADTLRDRRPEIDLNPLVAREAREGALAVDVLVRFAGP